MSKLKKTPIFSEYVKWGAKTIDFGGWDLPVQYAGIKHEHEVTRTKAGLFDVSHMGEIVVKGRKSTAFLQQMVTNDVAALSPKQVQYTFMCYEDGGTVDDLLIYKLDIDHYLLAVNASNLDKDLAWHHQHNTYKEEDVMIKDESAQYALLALQGPKAERILQSITDSTLQEIRFFTFDDAVSITSIQAKAIVSRTGYTGEDGFEIYIDQASGPALWNLILEVGKSEGIEPVGLGARDTLRFEANLPLYGQELSENISPVEAGLQFAVKVNKPMSFIGKEALSAQITNGASRKIVGIEMIDRGIPRHEYAVFINDDEIGYVTSGTQSPTLKKNIGRAIVREEFTAIGTELAIQVRKRRLRAVVVPTPFYIRDK